MYMRRTLRIVSFNPSALSAERIRLARDEKAMHKLRQEVELNVSVLTTVSKDAFVVDGRVGMTS
jgi:hypothetical protein